jgi:hypothetical protein
MSSQSLEMGGLLRTERSIIRRGPDESQPQSKPHEMPWGMISITGLMAAAYGVAAADVTRAISSNSASSLAQ